MTLQDFWWPLSTITYPRVLVSGLKVGVWTHKQTLGCVEISGSQQLPQRLRDVAAPHHLLSRPLPDLPSLWPPGLRRPGEAVGVWLPLSGPYQQ